MQVERTGLCDSCKIILRSPTRPGSARLGSTALRCCAVLCCAILRKFHNMAIVRWNDVEIASILKETRPKEEASQCADLRKYAESNWDSKHFAVPGSATPRNSQELSRERATSIFRENMYIHHERSKICCYMRDWTVNKVSRFWMWSVDLYYFSALFYFKALLPFSPLMGEIIFKRHCPSMACHVKIHRWL